MGLETATFISDFVASNPPGTDLESQGANHLRLIKSVLQNTFPVTGKAFNFPSSSAKSVNYSVQKGDLNTKFVATTSGGAFTFTLPTLVAGDAGWICEFLKIGSDVNPFFVAPPSGTLQSGEISGLTSARRCIPGRVTQAFWTGSNWILTRVPSVPLGTILDCQQATLPIGYEWANGQTLASASTNYPDFFAANGSSGVVFDYCGRVGAGMDALGGGATRIGTVPTDVGTIVGSTRGSTGGSSTHVLTAGEIAVHTHALNSATGNAVVGGEVNVHNGVGQDHTHTVPIRDSQTFQAGSTAIGKINGVADITTSGRNAGHFHDIGGATENNAGGGGHAMLQPTIMVPKIVVVE